MFIIRNIPEQKYFVDIKHVTVTADSPDLSLFNAEIILATNGYYLWGVTTEIKLLRCEVVNVVNVSR